MVIDIIVITRLTHALKFKFVNLFVSGNICTCVHRTTFYEIVSIKTIKHATESITLNIVSLLSMLMYLSNDIAHHNPSQLAILPGNTFSILI